MSSIISSIFGGPGTLPIPGQKNRDQNSDQNVDPDVQEVLDRFDSRQNIEGDISQELGLRVANRAITQADQRTLREDQERRRAGEVVPTGNQGAIGAVGKASLAEQLINRLDAGERVPRSKLTLEERQKVISKKKKERAQRGQDERGKTLTRRTAGALQSLFTRDSDIPEETFPSVTLGKRVLLGGGLRT